MIPERFEDRLRDGAHADLDRRPVGDDGGDGPPIARSTSPIVGGG